jgi:chromate transporter
MPPGFKVDLDKKGWRAVHSPRDFAVALVGFVLLVAWRAPPLIVVAFSAAAGTAMAFV